jgi:hypothetical protein
MPVLPASSSTRTQLGIYQLLVVEYNLKIKAYELAQNKYKKA